MSARVTAAERLIRQETEAEFSAKVKLLADLLGWWGYHTYRSDRSPAGFPDWTFVRGDRLVFAELKRAGATARESPKPIQRKVLWMLASTGRCEVYVWTPREWPQIETVLR